MKSVKQFVRLEPTQKLKLRAIQSHHQVTTESEAIRLLIDQAQVPKEVMSLMATKANSDGIRQDTSVAALS